MIKKIILTLALCPLVIHAAERKEAPAAPAAPKPSLGFSGTVPFKIDAPDLIKVAAILSNSDALASLGLEKAAQALGTSDALERATKQLKEINITSEALEKAAKALSSIKIEGKPTLTHNLTHNHRLQIPEVDELATKGFGGAAFIYTLVHGSNPLITSCFGCLTFIPYPILKDAYWKTYGLAKSQLNRCFTHKRPRAVIYPREIDLEAAKALVKAH